MITCLTKKSYVYLLHLSVLLICTIIFGKHSDAPEIKIHWSTPDNHSHKFSYNIRPIQPSYNNNHHTHTKNHYYNPYIAYMSVSDFQYIFASISNKYDILNNYGLYAYPNFRSFASSLPCYKEFMLALHTKIQTDKNFKAQTTHIPGFNQSEFHKFVEQEVHNIRNNQTTEKKGTLHVSDTQTLDTLTHNCIQKINTTYSNNNHERLRNRLAAIEQTRKNNKTALDCQLHKELCHTRNTMHHLERTYSHDPHVQILAPVVYRYTTQAKNEICPLKAFELSDFCHTITQILENGMHILYNTSSAIGKGIVKGAHDFATIEHWKGMATGAVQLGLLFADAVGQEDALHYAMVLSATSDNTQALTVAAEQYCSYTQEQKDAIHACAQETYKKIKAMSWQEIVEHGTEIGTTLILDTLALNAINGFSRATSNLVIKELSSALESGALLTEQYAVEVAGFGKLIVEEGAEIANNTIPFVKKDLTILNNKNDSLIKTIEEIKEAGTVLKPIENSAWQSPGGLIYKADKKFGNRINHVLAHAKNNLIKEQHTVFNVPENKILTLIDEAWSMRGNPLEHDAAAYIIDMKKIIGLDGETAIKIVVIPDTSEILTAYPIKL